MRLGSYTALEGENERLRARMESKDETIRELQEQVQDLLNSNEELSEQVVRQADMINYLNGKIGS
jgi:chromosome segregation ATPase